MASDRTRSQVTRADLASIAADGAPGIAALFLINFDIRAGYTIGWKQNISDVELEDAVEYKSLPSGLHNVEEDLVYFIHGQHAGLSAFVNKPAAEEQRNALMLSVGILVPLSHGRLGRVWRHAAKLKELARYLADDRNDTRPLAEFWENYQLSEEDAYSQPESPIASVASLKAIAPAPELSRRRAVSEATALLSSKNVLAPYHPALRLPDFLSSFGPLIFPLYRAALLRKRILLLSDAPVETACNFVYNLSLLSSIPHSLLPLLPSARDLPALKPRPLFNVGIHDMSSLSQPPAPNAEECWIACSTDRVLGLKSDLYDIIVDLPPHYSKDAPQKIYPKISLSPIARPSPRKDAKPIQLKATQRDARRYLTLRSGLNELRKLDEDSLENNEEDSDNASTFSSSTAVEPISWPLLAYTSFIWWASAGEKGARPSDEESDQDARLLLIDDEHAPNIMDPSASYRRNSMAFLTEGDRTQEIALITYFRRLTTQIFSILFDIVSRQVESLGDEPGLDLDESSTIETSGERDDESTAYEQPISAREEPTEPLIPSPTRSAMGDDDDDATINIATSDLMAMGLDPWSDADKAFVEELVAVWWGRQARVEGSRIRCCGVRIL